MCWSIVPQTVGWALVSLMSPCASNFSDGVGTCINIHVFWDLLVDPNCFLFCTCFLHIWFRVPIPVLLSFLKCILGNEWMNKQMVSFHLKIMIKSQFSSWLLIAFDIFDHCLLRTRFSLGSFSILSKYCPLLPRLLCRIVMSTSSKYWYLQTLVFSSFSTCILIWPLASLF